MSRSFDTWNRYLDNKGNPLHGCVQFMVQDGNTLAPIFDQDDTPLPNPQITDIYGRTEHQVFINEDVVAYFYKYIGNGTWTTEEDIDTSDISKWSLQYTITSKNTLDLSIASNTYTCVPTIATLRNVNVATVPEIDGVKIITLLGYNNIGDKEPINYVWDSEETALNDDGGSVIQSAGSLTGRWIMVQPSEHCDSRHFGVFPSTSMNMEDQTYGIIKLFSYCDDKGIRPFFNGSYDNAWFKYSNINVVAKQIDTTKYTKFNDGGMSYITAEWNVLPTFYNSNTTLNTSYVDTSCGAYGYNTYQVVDFNTQPRQTNWQNCVVNINTNVSGYNFNNCEIHSNGKLVGDNNTFTNCKLTASMFDDDAELNGKCTNCSIDIQDFKDNLDLYKQIRLTSDTNPNFDYQNLPTSVNPFTYFNDNVVDSGVLRLSNFNAEGTVTIGKLNNTILELHNCTGKINLINYVYGDAVVIKGCKDLEITNLSSNVVILHIEDSTVVMPNKSVMGLSVRNSTITNGSITCSDFTSYSSVITTSIACKNLLIKDSQVNSNISQTINGICSTFIDNNIFNAQLTIAGASGTQIVNGTITNNIGNYSTPIVINRTYLDSVDAHHAYIYDNNKGTFPKRYAEFTQDVNILNDIQNFTGYEWVWTLGGGTGARIPWLGFSTYYYDDGSTYYRHHFKFTEQFSVFRIGTDDEIVEVDWKMNSINNNYGYIMPFKFKAKIVHTSGESYRLEGAWEGGAPSSPQTSQGQVASILNVFANVTVLGVATMNATFKLNLDS